MLKFLFSWKSLHFTHPFIFRDGTSVALECTIPITTHMGEAILKLDVVKNNIPLIISKTEMRNLKVITGTGQKNATSFWMEISTRDQETKRILASQTQRNKQSEKTNEIISQEMARRVQGYTRKWSNYEVKNVVEKHSKTG